MLFCPRDLVLHCSGDDGKAYELCVRVLKGGSCRLAFVFEYQDVFDPPVLPEGSQALMVGPKYVLKGITGYCRKREVMLWGLHYDLVGPHTPHLVEQALAFELEEDKPNGE